MHALSRLRWRCRRGMKELDILLERYLARDYATATTPEQAAFQALLELPDPELHAYLMGRETPTDGVEARVVARIARPDH